MFFVLLVVDANVIAITVVSCFLILTSTNDLMMTQYFTSLSLRGEQQLRSSSAALSTAKG
jgi:hypothetical protein